MAAKRIVLDGWREREVVSTHVARAVQGDMSRGKLYSEIREGRLVAVRDGGRTMITVQSIMERLGALPRLDAHARAA